MTTINERIYTVRKHLKVSQTAFAESLGTTRGVIVNLENGETSPKPQFISLLCSVYKINRNWLETGDGEMFKTPSVNDEIAEFVGTALSGNSDPVMRRVLLALSRMDEVGWQKAKEFLKMLKEMEEMEDK